MSSLSRVATFLKRHPVVALAFLTPGIPEYLSSSSPLNAIVLNPVFFPIQLALNLGLYTPGALLIREAMIRWNKGLGSVLIMGVAYGILEEGVALSTLFYSKATPVGNLGYYGHYAGVNWVWVAGILPFHAIFSIAMPIVLLRLALPQTNGERFLQGKKLQATVAVLIVDVIALMFISYRFYNFWMGDLVFVGSLLTIAILVYLARHAPPDLGLSKVAGRQGPIATLVVGIALWPVAVLSQGIPESTGVPASLDFAFVIVVQMLFMVYILRAFSSDNDRRKIVMAIGLILPIAVFGIIAEITLPVILLADAVFALFFRRLLIKYPRSKHHSVTDQANRSDANRKEKIEARNTVGASPP